MDHVFNFSNIVTGIVVVVVSGLIGWGARWIINQGPTATANQRLKDLLDTNERVMREMIAEKTALTAELEGVRAKYENVNRALARLALRDSMQQERIDLIEAAYTKETGKTLPPMAPLPAMPAVPLPTTP